MKISEVAKLTGVTVRTLQYYDKIGLLAPSEVTQNGYRIYKEETLEALQQILFFRELDFSLTQIREIMNDPHYDKTQALLKHKELLLQKRSRLDGLIALVERTLEGDGEMSFKEFDNTKIDENRKKYAQEIQERWGQTQAYAENQEKMANYSASRWDFVNGEMEELLKAFGKNRSLLPESGEAMELVRRWQEYITENFYECTNEILAGLGEMYISDSRFRENIDRHGEGTAEFMSKAIKAYLYGLKGKEKSADIKDTQKT